MKRPTKREERWNVEEISVKREPPNVDDARTLVRPFDKSSFYGSSAKQDPQWKTRLLTLTTMKSPFKLFFKQSYAFDWIDRTPTPDRWELHVFAEEFVFEGKNGRAAPVKAPRTHGLSPKPPVLSPTPPVLSPTPPILSPTPPVLSPTPPILSSTPPILSSTPPILSPKPPCTVSSSNLSRGSRRYLVSTYEEFWSRYVTIDDEKRHYYEVIREGEASKLYFDIEYNKTLNPKSDGDEMVETFIACVSEYLLKQHGLSVPRDGFLDLESQYDHKFSRHVVCPTAVFKDNIHCGAFVESLCEELSAQRDANASIDRLWIKTSEKGDKDIFIDRGVYTRNRNFRLPFSSKLAKGVPLVPSRTNQFLVPSKKDVFWAALVCNCTIGPGLLVSKALMLNHASKTHGECPMVQPFKRRKSNERPHESDASQWPDIDAFIQSVIRPGYIRKCLYFDKRSLIIYEIRGNRYCANIGRSHKSNHIMVCVDLVKRVYYQKCHDPDCRGFRSQEKMLPSNVGG